MITKHIIDHFRKMEKPKFIVGDMVFYRGMPERTGTITEIISYTWVKVSYDGRLPLTESVDWLIKIPPHYSE